MEYVPSSWQSFCSISRICNLIPESFTSANLKQAETCSTIRFHYHYAFTVQGIFKDFADPDPANNNQDLYTVCIWKLDHHFHAEENIPFEWRVFRQMAPHEGKLGDKYLVHLRQQTRLRFRCGISRKNLQEQLIKKLTDMELKREIVSNKNITEHHKQERRKRPNNKSSAWRLEQVLMPSERLKKRPGTSQEKQASFMWRRDILLGIRVVQQTEEKCAKSSKYGHFASCCKGNHSSLESGKDSQQKKASNGKKGAGRQTNQGVGYSMEDEHVSSEERNPAFAFAAMKEALKEVCMVSILSVRTKTQTKLIVGYCLSLQLSWRMKLCFSTNLTTMKSYLAFQKKMRLSSFGCSFLLYAWESKQGSGLFWSNSEHLLPWGISKPF